MDRYNLTIRFIFFIIFSAFDTVVTEFVLENGGSELNPVFDMFLQNGYTVLEAKINLLAPAFFIWFKIYKEDKETGVAVLNTAVWIMAALFIFEVFGLIWYWTS